MVGQLFGEVQIAGKLSPDGVSHTHTLSVESEEVRGMGDLEILEAQRLLRP